jgi:hypothetical protein
MDGIMTHNHDKRASRQGVDRREDFMYVMNKLGTSYRQSE